MADHDDAVEHRSAEQRDEPDCGRHAQVDAGQVERDDAANRRERNVREDDPGAPDRAERVEEQDEDQEHADRHDDGEPRHRALLVLELAAERDVVAGLQRHAARDLRLRFPHDAAHVPPADEHRDRHQPAARFAADVHVAALD